MRNRSLNILKAICAILIVFNHCHFTGIADKLISNYGRIAVPIFFLISGYFCYKKSNEKIKNKVFHILKLLIVSSIFWYVYNFIRYYLIGNNELDLYLTSFIGIKPFIKTIVFNVNLCHEHLWFINALLYCYIIQFFINFVFQKKKDLTKKTELFLSILLLILYQIINALFIKDDLSNIYLIKNFIFVGYPFFSIGKYINDLNIKKIKVNIVILISLIIINTIEILLYRSELYITSIILAIYLFLVVIKNDIYKNNFLEYIGDKLSLYVYVLHPSIKYIVLFFLDYLGINGIFINIYPVLCLIITILISHILYKTIYKYKVGGKNEN